MFRRRETAGGMATPTALRTATNDDGDEARTPTPLRSALKKGARRDATRRDAMRWVRDGKCMRDDDRSMTRD